MSRLSHFLAHATKHKPPTKPRLARITLAGSGIELVVKEKFASAWNWKSVPFTPLIVPILGTKVGGPVPGALTKSAEGLTSSNGVTIEALNIIWLMGVPTNAGL